MIYGDHQLDVSPGQVVRIRAADTFMVFAETDGEKVRILGPNHSTDRFCKVVVPTGIDSILIECDPDCAIETQVSDQPSRFEEVDPVPIEVPAFAGRPETTEEIVARMLHTHLRNEEDKREAESWEQANDFDVDEDEWVSPYELVQMADDEPLDLESLSPADKSEAGPESASESPPETPPPVASDPVEPDATERQVAS